MLLRLQGRECLVVGAGKIAADKIKGLLAHGARVTVVSPRAVARIQAQARTGRIRWEKRVFRASDVESAFLVVSATNSADVNEEVYCACRERGVLCNAVDDPERCDFYYPAVVRRGPLQIAISTNGKSPALASRLRKEIEQQFGPEWAGWIEHIGRARREVLEQQIPSQERRRKLLDMASPEAFRVFRRNSRRSGRSQRKQNP
jgi:precorrin-2 dehydrogenase/sirohydrochlorin ferrochelatase